MSIEEIVAMKHEIDGIERQLGELQSRKLLLGLRFALLLKQNAKDNPPVEPIKQMSQTSEMQHGPYVTGFENRPHAGTGFEGTK
jgi:hypothetical protein